MIKQFLFIFLLVLLSSQAHLQEVDSLYKVLKSKKSDTIKLLALSDLCWIYSTQDYTRSKLYATNELKLAQKVDQPKWIALAYNDIGISFHKFGFYDSALVYYKKSLRLRESLHDEQLIASSLSKIGVAYQEKGSYKDALQYQFRVLKIFEKNSMDGNIGITLNNIATIFEKLKEHEKAIFNAKKALTYHLKSGDEYSQAQCYGTIGNCYNSLKKFEQAYYNFQKALPIFTKFNDQASVANVENGIGLQFSLQNKYDLALIHYQKALKISNEINDNSGFVFYAHNMSHVYKKLGRYEEAEALILELLNAAFITEAQKLFIYKQLVTIYGYMDNGKKVEFYLDKYSDLKEKMFNSTDAKAIAKYEAKYDTEKTRRLLAENQIKLASRQKWLLISGALLIILLLILWSVYRYQKAKRQNQLREIQFYQEIETTKLEKDFVDEKIRIARELHDNIGSHLTFMISSLDNLTYVKEQDKKLEKINDLSNFGRLTMKDLRDTIWAMNHDDGNLEQLLTRISELRSVLPSNLDVEIYSESSKDTVLSGIQLLNLYRIVQEFIQNTIKYAEANLVKIQFHTAGNKLILKLDDNGNGFDLKNIHFGNGILNMKRRCEDLFGEFSLQSNGNGTQVICQVPCNKKGTI